MPQATDPQSSRKPPRMVVGFDLHGASTGAVQFASWLCRESGMDAADFVHPVHAIEPATMAEFAPHADTEAIKKAVASQVARLVQEADLAHHLPMPEVFSGVRAAEALETAFKRDRGEMIIVGRKAPRSVLALARIGPTARRLLHELKAVVAVVPPALLASDMGEGPVLVGVDESESCDAAVAFAQRLGKALGRPLTFVHAIPRPHPSGPKLVSSDGAAIPLSAGYSTLGDPEYWTERFGIAAEQLAIVSGSVAVGLLEVARDLDSPLIVCGSRQCDPWQRALTGSVADEVSSRAPCPTIVVPPG